MDAGLILTGVAAGACLMSSNGIWLRRILFASWLTTSFASIAGAGIGVTVLLLASTDMVIALISLVRLTQYPDKAEARAVGGLSMALMPGHFIMAASSGGADWTLYASACNAVFILQCLTAGGWLDGVGRGIAGFWGRLHPVRSLRDRGR